MKRKSTKKAAKPMAEVISLADYREKKIGPSYRYYWELYRMALKKYMKSSKLEDLQEAERAFGVFDLKLRASLVR